MLHKNHASAGLAGKHRNEEEYCRDGVHVQHHTKRQETGGTGAENGEKQTDIHSAHTHSPDNSLTDILENKNKITGRPQEHGRTERQAAAEEKRTDRHRYLPPRGTKHSERGCGRPAKDRNTCYDRPGKEGYQKTAPAAERKFFRQFKSTNLQLHRRQLQ